MSCLSSFLPRSGDTCQKSGRYGGTKKDHSLNGAILSTTTSSARFQGFSLESRLRQPYLRTKQCPRKHPNARGRPLSDVREWVQTLLCSHSPFRVSSFARIQRNGIHPAYNHDGQYIFFLEARDITHSSKHTPTINQLHAAYSEPPSPYYRTRRPQKTRVHIIINIILTYIHVDSLNHITNQHPHRYLTTFAQLSSLHTCLKSSPPPVG